MAEKLDDIVSSEISNRRSNSAGFWRRASVLGFSLSAFLISSCGFFGGAAPTQTPSPVPTVPPTNTPSPTATRAPTPTFIPVYELTVTPTALEFGNEAAILSDYVNEVLQPAYVPEKLDVQHKLSTSGTLTSSDYVYGAIWSVGGTQFYAHLEYDPKLTQLNALSILMVLQKQVEPNKAKASELIRTYFKGVGEIGCQDLEGRYVCEHFIPGKDKNQGSGLITFYETERTMLFSCVVFKDSEMFEWNSCVKRE
jgi:hypothetical protein